MESLTLPRHLPAARAVVIVAASAVPPHALAGPVGRLAAALEYERLPVALRRFGDEVAHPAADFVVAALIVASEHQARDLSGLLGQLATTALDEAGLRTRVWVGLARTRTAVRVIAGVVPAMVGAIFLIDRHYLDPYNSASGQLALLFVQRLEVPVVLTDLDQARVDKGVGWVHGEIDTLVSKRKISADKGNRLRALVTGSTDTSVFSDADVVIEAVFEDLKVKQQVFAQVESVVSDTCLLLTNTSSLSVSAMADGLVHPERVVGFHFFNPVALMPLLEIARAERTDDASLATAFALGKQLKKSCVLVKDAPAFVVNRLLTRFLGEVTAAFDEGTPFDVTERALDPLGLPMSPFVLLQLVGPAVAFHTAGTMHEAFPDRYSLSENQRRIVESGTTTLLAWDGAVPRITDEVAALMTVGDSPSTGDQVRQRALDAVADEARRMLDEGVVAAPQDIDLCMLLGAGWPFHLGGLTPYLDRTGTSERVTGRRFLPPGVASVPR